MTRPGDRFEPDPAAHAAYDALVGVHADVSVATDPVLRRLAGPRSADRPLGGATIVCVHCHQPRHVPAECRDRDLAI